MELKTLKEKYAQVQPKYSLPSFAEIDERFELDRINRETDFVLRGVRKVMVDKIISYVRFLEMILNPAQSLPLFLYFAKNIPEAERKVISHVYKELAELELQAIKLEIDYSETDEAKAINHIYKTWETSRPKMREVLAILDTNWNGTMVKKEKGYFG